MVYDCFVGLVCFVIGRVVGSVAVGVVPATVFIAIPGYIGGERDVPCGGVGCAVPFVVGGFLV